MGGIRESIFSWLKRRTTHFRLTFYASAVGVVAGVGAILFDRLVGLSFRYLIQIPVGYREPGPGTLPERLAELASSGTWLLILIPAVGGLAAGLIVTRLAPEAEGHGTDAMIEAFHQHGGQIRKRVPLVKLVASALTIGSGGSAGKEGPIAQIGAGFGSFLAGLLGLKAKERRILVLAGAAGGIGAIFQAPLGAALFAPEVLYRETEFEYEAILPCIVSSIIAYALFSIVVGRHALFFPGPVDFSLPVELLPALLFGVLCAGAGYFYVHIFYGMRDRLFRPLRIPTWLKPALGGLMLGVVGFAWPQVLDGGYGWVQVALEGKLFWGTMLLLAFLKIAGTSFTISSGGSGGVFGPSLFIGAMLGGAFGFFGHAVAPGWVVHPNSFVLVGMGGFFAGVAKVPIASIIMTCEMSASYTLLVPLMLVAAVSSLLLLRTSLYEKQLITRLASPAHLTEFSRGMLEKIRVWEALRDRPLTRIPEDLPFGELVRIVTRSEESHFPVVDREGRMTGILSINDIREFMFEEAIAHLILARDVATREVVRVHWGDTLREALEKMSAIDVDEIPVVRPDAPGVIVGMISKRDIVDYYYSSSLR